MKKLLVIATMMITSLFAQSQTLTFGTRILMDGISNFEQCKITFINYTTKNSESFIVVKGMKYQMQLNCEYAVMVEKEGFISKMIKVSTIDKTIDLNKSYKFVCIIDIHSSPDAYVNNAPLKAGGVFYDNSIEEFNFYTLTASGQ